MPDVEFGPVGQREDADAFALVDAGVVDAPKFGPLVLGIPGMAGGAEGKDALLGAGFFLVAARARRKAASKPYLSSACFRLSVFITWVCSDEPEVERD